MKAKHIKVGLKVKPKKKYAERYGKPPISTIERVSGHGIISLSDEIGVYSPEYFCKHYKLAVKG